MPSSSAGDVAICRAFFDHAVFLDGVRSTTNGRAVHGTVGAFASLAGDAAPEAFFFCWSKRHCPYAFDGAGTSTIPSSSTGDVAICRAFFDHAVILDGVRSTTNGRAGNETVGASTLSVAVTPSFSATLSRLARSSLSKFFGSMLIILPVSSHLTRYLTGMFGRKS